MPDISGPCKAASSARNDTSESTPSSENQEILAFQRDPSFLRLPVEVLGLILHYSRIASEGEVTVDPRDVPLHYSLVCSKIHTITLSTSSVWARIFVTWPFGPKALNQIRRRLSLAKLCLLDIEFDFHDPEWDFEEDDHSFDPAHIPDILDTLLPHSGRWRSITVRADTWKPIHTFLTQTLTVTSLSNLIAVRLERCNALYCGKYEGRPYSFHPSRLQAPVSLFNGIPLPRLESVSLSGVHVDWTIPSLRSLAELKLKYHSPDVLPSLSTFMTMLEASPQLESLSLQGWGLRIEDEVHPHSIALPHLRNLELGFVDEQYSVELLSLFFMPALECLSLEDVTATVCITERAESSVVVEYLLEQSQHPVNSTGVPAIPLSQLTSLTLDSLDSVPGDLIGSLFREAQNLRRLGLNRMNDDVLVALATYRICPRSSEMEMVCPLLQEIACRKINLELFLCVVRHRKHFDCRSPLKCLTLGGCIADKIGSETLQRMEKAAKSMELVLSIKEWWYLT